MALKIAGVVAMGLSLVAVPGWAALQDSGGDARAIVQAAVKAELTANDNDHT